MKNVKQFKKNLWTYLFAMFTGAIGILMISGALGSSIPGFREFNDKILHTVVEIACGFFFVWAIPYLYKGSKELFQYCFKNGPEPK